ncbi:MAG: reverse transcriptase domain-containing protein [Candidatus Woesearchaeota archaeon]
MIEFEEKLDENLRILRQELTTRTYRPNPLITFIIRDPKTRKISKSDFRDRIIHHAICNIIEPIFDKTFIHDSYANRKGKGTLAAIKRFDSFKRKVSKNNKPCYFLKADIKHYFDTVDHNILINILNERIRDEDTIQLITIVLRNHKTKTPGKGMPLGNLTSQFFANVYLNELDQYIKHILKAKSYLRYVDDFLIVHHSRRALCKYKTAITLFLQQRLGLDLHPDKSRILGLEHGADFLGFRVFYHHKLVRMKNLKKHERTFKLLKQDYANGLVERGKITEKLEGWLAFVNHANTFKYQKALLRSFDYAFPQHKTQPATKTQQHEHLRRKVRNSNLPFSSQKTLLLLKRGLSVEEIAKQRNIQKGTVWSHFAQLIEHDQLHLSQIMSKEKIKTIRESITSPRDPSKEIRAHIPDNTITYDEIACVLEKIKTKSTEKEAHDLTKWYQRTNCRRKCCKNQEQIRHCKEKFRIFTANNPLLKMTRKEFVHLFNENMNICVLPEYEKKRVVCWNRT